MRLFRTPANSVPSDYFFSAQNHIHNKVHNRLSSTRVDKLTYIYLNCRVLNHKTGKPRQWQELSGNAASELEHVIVGLEDVIDTGSDEGIIIEILFNRNTSFAFPIY